MAPSASVSPTRARAGRVDRRGIELLLERGAGVVRARDLRQLGVTPDMLADSVGPSGPWRVLLPGVVLTSRAEPTRQQWLHSALLYAGEGAVLSGWDALRLAGVELPDGAEPPRAADVVVLASHGCRRRGVPGLVVERTRRLPAGVRNGGFPCAPPARAAIDAARRTADLDRIRALLAAAVWQEHCTLAELAEELAHAQRRGTRLARQAMSDLAAGVRTRAQVRLRELVHRSGFARPEWRRSVLTEGGAVLRPEAVWPRLGVAIWIGPAARHAGTALDRRQRALVQERDSGLLVLVIDPADLLDHSADVRRRIRDVLSYAAGRPAPDVRLGPPARPPFPEAAAA